MVSAWQMLRRRRLELLFAFGRWLSDWCAAPNDFGFVLQLAVILPNFRMVERRHLQTVANAMSGFIVETRRRDLYTHHDGESDLPWLLLSIR